MRDRNQPGPVDYIGSGWAFPPSFDLGARSVRTVAGETDILESLTILFKTELNERVLFPDYGSALESLLFSNLDDTTLGELEEMVRRTIRDHEPRIWVEEVTTTLSPSDRDRVDIRVQFTVRHTNSRASMVFPFYLSEGTQL